MNGTAPSTLIKRGKGERNDFLKVWGSDKGFENVGHYSQFSNAHFWGNVLHSHTGLAIWPPSQGQVISHVCKLRNKLRENIHLILTGEHTCLCKWFRPKEEQQQQKTLKWLLSKYKMAKVVLAWLLIDGPFAYRKGAHRPMELQRQFAKGLRCLSTWAK